MYLYIKYVTKVKLGETRLTSQHLDEENLGLNKHGRNHGVADASSCLLQHDQYFLIIS